MLTSLFSSANAHTTDYLKNWCEQHSGFLETTGNNRGPIVDNWNRAFRAPLGSPYCATGTSAALEAGNVFYPKTRTAWARDFLKNEGVDAVDVFYGKAEPPIPSVAAFTRKGGGHAGLLFGVIRKVLRMWEPNTSAPNGMGSQWNGGYTGFKERSIKAACSPWNSFRIRKFIPIEFHG